MNTFDCLIPVPQRVDFSDKDTLTIAEIKNFYIAGAFCDFTAEIEELFSFFGFVINHTARQDDAQLVIFQAAMPPEGFRINIFSDRISITAADSAGLRYAIEAMRQMIFAAAICGPSAANLFYVFCIPESTLLALFMPSGNVRNRAPGRYRRPQLRIACCQQQCSMTAAGAADDIYLSSTLQTLVAYFTADTMSLTTFSEPHASGWLFGPRNAG